MSVINLNTDIPLNIAVGLNASSKVWKNTKTSWSELVNRLSVPTVTNETYEQYMSASKADQSKIKDVGGFVGGYLKNGRRDKASIINRQVVALDVDFSNENLWWDFTLLYDCAACIHSTHKSNARQPRHRLILPLDRPVTPEEYQAISRRLAGNLNIELFDQSTFDINRLMFWPSVSSNSEYYFEYQDGPILCADEVLDTYIDWHDVAEWPASSSIEEIVKKNKQEDPTDKSGLIGAFCRTYTIQEAIDKFLPDIYEQAGEGRYTFTGGSTAAGLIVYEDKFAYSHHGTDPAGGKLCNAFDLVRIHKFGHLDPVNISQEENQRKSFKAMEKFVAEDPLTKRQIGEERLADAKIEFGDSGGLSYSSSGDIAWAEQLTLNIKGEYDNSANNLNIIFHNDENLKGAFKTNRFDEKRYITKPLPWRKNNDSNLFGDTDYSGVRNYIECMYGIVSSQKIDDALNLEFDNNAYHPVRDYILSQVWDKKERIDTLLIDYFGAEDNAYTRAAIRKMLVAAVARVFEPGIKFDTALILVGEQGTYKSTFVKKLGVDWFSDTFTTVQGKEAFEQIQGVWIMEMAELSGLRKAEVESIKQYLSKSKDDYRPAYGRVTRTFLRQCIFFGTTNSKNFLRDPTGNRRFMPIDVRPEYVTKSVVDDLTREEIGQIWAEAYQLYKKGEALYLSRDIEKIARTEQAKHQENDERRGLVEAYLDKLFPHNWDELDLYDRHKWLDDPLAAKGTVPKDFTCALEVWVECLGEDKNKFGIKESRVVNDILRSLPDWEYFNSTKSFQLYGKQRFYKRKDSLL